MERARPDSDHLRRYHHRRRAAAAGSAGRLSRHAPQRHVQRPAHPAVLSLEQRRRLLGDPLSRSEPQPRRLAGYPSAGVSGRPDGRSGHQPCLPRLAVVHRLSLRHAAGARLLHRDGPGNGSLHGHAAAQLAAAGAGLDATRHPLPMGDLLRGPDRPQLRQPGRAARVRRHPALLRPAGRAHHPSRRGHVPVEAGRHQLRPPAPDPRHRAAAAGDSGFHGAGHAADHRDQRAAPRKHELLWS